MGTNKTDTQTVLASLATQLGSLDDQDLQREIAGLQGDLNGLNRLIQERIAVLQLKQFALQREQERASRGGGLERADLDKAIVGAIDQIERAVVGINDQALQDELQSLQQDVQALNRQINERQSALNLKHALAQPQIVHTQIMIPNMLAPGVQVSLGPAFAQVPAANRKRVDPDVKRQTILEILRERPEREWSPAQLKSALIERGIAEPDDGTPIRALLRRMSQDNAIIRVGQGRYALVAPAPITAPAVSEAPLAASAREILTSALKAAQAAGSPPRGSN